jgi:hypothetical protein
MKAIKVLSVVMSLAVLTLFGASGSWAQEKAKDAKAAPAAMAEKGKVVRKVLMENAKVIVFETTYQPGDANTTIASTTTRVVRSLTGGTQQTTSADGKKETRVRKAGDVWISEPGPAYTNTNIGKTVITNYVVQLK